VFPVDPVDILEKPSLLSKVIIQSQVIILMVLPILVQVLASIVPKKAAEPPVIARKVAAEENPERIINPKEDDTINKSPNYYRVFNKSIIIYIISVNTRHPLL